jgi:rhomboid protease GluP
MNMEMERIFKNLPRKKADLILLILASQGIEAQGINVQGVNTQKVNDQNLDPGIGKQQNHHKPGHTDNTGRFDIMVPKEKMEAAFKNIDQYFQENKSFRLFAKIQDFEISSFNAPAAFAIMALLLSIHLFCLEFNIHREMILKFGASALFIGQGETFRAITALFLHSDGQHLLGNMVGILIFGAPLISLSGYGTAPFLLLCAGTWGNLVNAYFHQNAHLSIGASTAIMGAAGALAAYQMTGKGKPLRFNRLIPLFAGATLVGMFSHGENTDVSAHFFGFVSGLFIGILFFPLYRVFHPRFTEPAALILVFLILGSAVWIGL